MCSLIILMLLEVRNVHFIQLNAISCFIGIQTNKFLLLLWSPSITDDDDFLLKKRKNPCAKEA